jgi:hypothetical protein
MYLGQALVFLLILVQGCATTQLPGYDFAILKPKTNPGLTYSDDKIAVVFKIKDDPYEVNVEGWKQYKRYKGIGFLMQNLTKEVLILDWNKIAFTAPDGNSSNVTHGGIKYHECSNLKAPSIIPPNGKIEDVILPCYAVKWVDDSSLRWGSGPAGWNISVFPSPRTNPEISFGIFMPIQIGEKIINYEFAFNGKTQFQTKNK